MPGCMISIKLADETSMVCSNHNSAGGEGRFFPILLDSISIVHIFQMVCPCWIFHAISNESNFSFDSFSSSVLLELFSVLYYCIIKSP